MKYSIAVIYGSTRTERQGIKAAKFVVNQLKETGNKVALVDAASYNLPLLDKMYKEYEAHEAPKSLKEISQILEEADGFVLVTGEYNHSVPPALKNLLDHFQQEYYFKPSAIVSYSAGPFGGVRAAPHLRVIAGELGMPAISSMFAISKVSQAFDENGKALEEAYNHRIQRFIQEFLWYLAAFKKQRSEGTPY